MRDSRGRGRSRSRKRWAIALAGLAMAVLAPNGAADAAEGDEPRFDFSVREIAARDFFLQLAEDSPYDIIVHPKVRGTLTLTLRGASVPDILETAREAYGFGFRRTPTGFVVLPSELRSQVFEINYFHVQRLGMSETRVSSGQLSEHSGGGSSSQPFGPTTTGGESGADVIENSRVVTESESDLWAELEETLRSIVGEGEGRSVVMSPQAGIAVVRAMPDELRQVSEYLSLAERNLTRQVILDTKILEVRLDDGFQSGVNWAALFKIGAKSIVLSQTGGGTLLGSGASEIAGNTGLLDPADPSLPSTTDTSTFGGVFSGAFDLDDFTAVVELLETQGDVHVLSSPRVTTTNNQKAVIKVGSDEFFVTDVSTTTVTGTATTTSPDVTLTPFFSGIALDVLPQIASDGSVLLHVHPSVSRVVEQIRDISVGTSDPLVLPLALSTIRETDTVIRAENEQVVVIGGLIEERDSHERASIPILGRIPWVGKHLFGQQLNTTTKTELVILIRPQVVEAGRAPHTGTLRREGSESPWESWTGPDGWGG